MYLKEQMDQGKSLKEALENLMESYEDEHFDILDPETWDKKKRCKCNDEPTMA